MNAIAAALPYLAHLTFLQLLISTGLQLGAGGWSLGRFNGLVAADMENG